MSKLLLVAALVGLSAHDAAACSLFEGIYKAPSGHVARYTPDLSVRLFPGGRLYEHNDHCIMPDCASDSMVTFDAGPTDSFASPIIDDTDNPPPVITIKDEPYRFYCPSDAPQETM